MKIILTLSAVLFISPGAFAQAPGGESPEFAAKAIVEKMESHQNPPFMTTDGTMNLKDRFGTRSITFHSWSSGEDKMLLEFTSDAEFGQKILRLKGDIYLYYPDADKVLPIRGSALGDSVMGSDMSYEDLTGNKSLLESYDAVLQGEETILDRPCWVLKLTSKVRDVAFAAQTLWVDKDLLVVRQAHQFARSGRLLRTMKVLEVTKQGNFRLPSRTLLEDQLKRGTSTEFLMNKTDLVTPVLESKFSLHELGK